MLMAVHVFVIQCTSKLKTWHEETREEAKEWIDKINSLSIMVTGRTGSGKTSLINGLVGEKVGIEGKKLTPETRNVMTVQKELNKVLVTIWVTPGLQDGTSHEKEYLHDMKTKCKGADLNIYCISITNMKFDESDLRAIQLFTSTFGVSFWNRTVFVLTFANQAILNYCPEGVDVGTWINSKVEEWKKVFLVELTKHGVPEVVKRRMVFIPAGYHSPTKYARNPWQLPGIDNWFHNFWYACASQMNCKHLPALIKINVHRFKKEEDITEDDLQNESIENQPIPAYSLAGSASECGVGALVGAVGGALVGAEAGAIVRDLADVMDPADLLALFRTNIYRHHFKEETTGSDLKETIENVPLPRYLEQELVDTKEPMFKVTTLITD